MYDLLSLHTNLEVSNVDNSKLEQPQVYCRVGEIVQMVISSPSIDTYNEAKAEISKIIKLLIALSKESVACGVLDYFRMELTSKINHHWNPKIRELIEELDFTEVFHNLAYLKLMTKDYDGAFYYFASAGEQYSLHNCADINTYPMMLLKTHDMPFENVIRHICRNCTGMGMFRLYEYREYYGEDLRSQHFIDLLTLFSNAQLFQFVLTNMRFWDLFSLEHNKVKGLIMARLLGELSWLFESFLKPTTKQDKLSRSLQKLLCVDKTLKDKYDPIDNIRLKCKDSVNSDCNTLVEVIQKFEETQDSQYKAAICLYTVYIVRNHTSHNLDEGFLLFSDDLFTKKLYMLQLMAFFVAKNLIVNYTKE
jgi:hypothetical protein